MEAVTAEGAGPVEVIAEGEGPVNGEGVAGARRGAPTCGAPMLSLAGRERHARMKLKKYRNSSLTRSGRLEHFSYCSSSGERRYAGARVVCFLRYLLCDSCCSC